MIDYKSHSFIHSFIHSFKYSFIHSLIFREEIQRTEEDAGPQSPRLRGKVGI